MRTLVCHAVGIWVGLALGNFIFAFAALLIVGDTHSLAAATERSFFQLIAIAMFVWVLASKKNRSRAVKGF